MWVWLLIGGCAIFGIGLLLTGAYMEMMHVRAELNLARTKFRGLGSALRRDTPAFGGSHPLSTCVGCGSTTDGVHLDRFGSPCPYSEPEPTSLRTDDQLREAGWEEADDGYWTHNGNFKEK